MNFLPDTADYYLFYMSLFWHYENMLIYIYWNFFHQKLKIFWLKILILYIVDTH